MLSWLVHYKNKYPGAHILVSENSIDVYVGANHKVAIRKDGGGSWGCHSAAHGAEDCHDLAPIPRAARVHKVVEKVYGKDKKGIEQVCLGVGRDEKADEREKAREEFMDDNGKVLSMAELALDGFIFDDKGDVNDAKSDKKPVKKSSKK